MFAWWWYRSFKKRENIDIVIDEAGGWPLLSPLYEKRVPIFFFVHHIGDKEFEAFGVIVGSMAKWVYRRLFSLYRNVRTIAVSPSTKEELIKDF